MVWSMAGNLLTVAKSTRLVILRAAGLRWHWRAITDNSAPIIDINLSFMLKRAFHLVVGMALVAGTMLFHLSHLASDASDVDMPAVDMYTARGRTICLRCRYPSGACAGHGGITGWRGSLLFFGTREGAADVRFTARCLTLPSARTDEAGGDREQIAAGWNRHVRKLGNGSCSDDDGRMRLFVVAAVGGWAASRIVVLESTIRGKLTFDKALVDVPEYQHFH